MDIACWPIRAKILGHRPSRAPEDRLDHRLLPLSGGRRKGNPGADSRAIERAEATSAFGPAELVHFGGDGHDADRPRTRKIDEHALFDLGVTASVEEQNEATEERPTGEIALSRGGEPLAIALRGARKAVAGKVHDTKSDSAIDEEVDTPCPARGLAHSREVTPAADAVQQ
jgi:hypothetical protein